MSIFQAAQIVLSTVLARSAGISDPYVQHHTSRQFEEALVLLKNGPFDLPSGFHGEYTIMGAMAIAKAW